jgi:hydroxymethylglutaryl-CoA lyase
LSTSTPRRRLPERVTIVEVGPRDGLQNQPQKVSTKLKIGFIKRLVDAGLKVVEATSFVNPRWVPQLSDAAEVVSSLEPREDVRYPVLVPNEEGLERAIDAGAKEVAIFVSATETFSRKNLNRSREEAFDIYERVTKRATDAGLPVRGYISMVFGDPWEGAVKPAVVIRTAKQLMKLGCYEVSLGDTIGIATPGQVRELLRAMLRAEMDPAQLAVHFHDTYGQGLVNVMAALELGVTVIDSSAGGLGGCPFAHSATGNLATEDLVWMLDGLRVASGVDVRAVAAASNWLCGQTQIPIPGRVARALGP